MPEAWWWLRDSSTFIPTARNNENYRLKAMDGVTTALEMEIGTPDIQEFLRERKGRALIHYGATISHPFVRTKVKGGKIIPGALVPAAGPATETRATDEEMEQIKDLLQKGIDLGALGIGMGIGYTPAATQLEIIEIFRLAAHKRVPVYVHVRSKKNFYPGSSIEPVAEVIAAAAVSGASLHIVHIASSGLQDTPLALKLVEGARARGLDVTTEAYPYIAGMTAINASIFNPGWQKLLGIDYGGLQLVETGERLTRARFEQLRALHEPKLVLAFVNTDTVVDQAIRHPLVMIASDGIVQRGKGHPRGAGTFSRVLARYVRSQGRITLMDALRKMSLMPAQRLETATAAARRKGRLREGADADIVIFDAETIQDRATYEAPNRFSEGVRHLFVSGTLVVSEGKLVEKVAPGEALVASTGN